MVTTLAPSHLATPLHSPTHLAHPSPRPTPRALIVADDSFAGGRISAHLARGGFVIDSVAPDSPLLAEIGRTRPHVIFLCLAENGGAAISLCEDLRRSISTPIVVCSSTRHPAQVVGALQAGADDYFVMSMQTGEVLARIRAVLRRVRRSRAGAQPQGRIVAGDLEVRQLEHRAYRNGALIDLSRTEFRLLTALVSQAGRTVSHQKLLADVWGDDYRDGGATLRIYISRLRTKLGNDALIASTRSLGYRFQPATAVTSPAA